MRVNTVRFSPSVRTAWHAHAVGQTLYVTEGIGLIQSRGGEVIEIRPGDVIYTPPGEWHWHGAAPNHFMTHIAMWEAPRPTPDRSRSGTTSSPTRTTTITDSLRHPGPRKPRPRGLCHT
jgi:quercetin dioxygenase-like cupin family protein